MNDDFALEEYQPNLDPTLSEIQECCKRLGINKISDPELEYIAIELLRAPLPDGWKFYKSKTNPSSYFFYNESTNTIQTQHPSYQTFLQRYNTEKQKKSENYDYSEEYTTEFDGNEKDVMNAKKYQAEQLAQLKLEQEQEIEDLISGLDSPSSDKSRKQKKYEISLKKYANYSESNKARIETQISDLKKAFSRKINEIKQNYENDLLQEKEQYEKRKKELKDNFETFQKSIEEKRLQELKKFEIRLDEDKQQIVHKKFKRKLKFFVQKPINIKPKPLIIKLKRSKPFSLDIIDDDSQSEIAIKESLDNNITFNASQTEIPPFSLHFNKSDNKMNVSNNSIFNEQESSSSDGFQFLFPQQEQMRLKQKSAKLENQMSKTTSGLKKSIESTYDELSSDFSSMKQAITEQTNNINNEKKEFQQKTFEMTEDFNSAMSELQNVYRAALNTISSLQTNLSPPSFSPQYPQVARTPQPRRTSPFHDIIDDRNSNKYRNSPISRKRRDKKYRKYETESYEYEYDDSDSSDDLPDTTAIRKLKKYQKAFDDAKKTQEKLTKTFKRVREQMND